MPCSDVVEFACFVTETTRNVRERDQNRKYRLKIAFETGIETNFLGFDLCLCGINLATKIT